MTEVRAVLHEGLLVSLITGSVGRIDPTLTVAGSRRGPNCKGVPTMIFGAHVVIYSTDASADRAFFRDVMGYASVDTGHDWLIFALPPAELAVHPADETSAHELFLMCDDIAAFIEKMTALGVKCSDLHTERWGSITKITLPGGGKLGVYQPSHQSPLSQG